MFKDEYQKEMSKIKPDASFLKDLEAKMEAAGADDVTGMQPVEDLQGGGKRSAGVYPIRRKRNVAAWATVAAAALICIGLGFAWQNDKKDVQDENYMTQNAGAVTEQETASDEGTFAGKSWYGEETDAEKIYGIMLDKMNSSKRLVIMESDGNDFVKAHEVSQPKEEELVEMLMGATLAENMTAEDLKADPVVYYLAEFDDGTIIKFAIYGETYFYCSEFEGIFNL